MIFFERLNTPKEDRIITPELMEKLKTVPVKAFMDKQR